MSTYSEDGALILQRLDYDCIVYVMRFIRDGVTYKSALLTNMFVHARMMPEWKKNVDRFSDHISTAVMMFPDLGWNWHYLTYCSLDLSVIGKFWNEFRPWALNLDSKIITFDFAIEHKSELLRHCHVVAKFGKQLLPYLAEIPEEFIGYVVDEDYVTQYEVKPHRFQYLSASMSADFIFKTRDIYPWHWRIVSDRRDLTEQQITDHYDLLIIRSLAWNYPIHLYNIPISLDGLGNILATRKFSDIDDINLLAPHITDWCGVSASTNISYQDIQNNPQLFWHPNSVATRTDVSFADAMAMFSFDNCDYDDLFRICRKPDADVMFIFDRIIDDARRFLVDEGVITIPIARKYPYLDINLGDISAKDILDNLDLPWDWDIISGDFSMADIKNNPHIIDRLDWQCVSTGSNITLEDIINNPTYPWDKHGANINDYRRLKWTHIRDNLPAYRKLMD